MQPKFILTPIPQFSWDIDGLLELSPNMFLGHLVSITRRKMLDAAKQANASDDVLMVTLESDHILVAKVQMRGSSSENSGVFNAALYTQVGDLALKRFVDVLRLTEDVPDCFERSCWYMADGNPVHDATSITLCDPKWSAPPGYEKAVHPGFSVLYFLHDPWKSRAPGLLQISELEEVFRSFWTDKKIVEEAHAMCRSRVQKLLRAQTAEQLGIPPEVIGFEWAGEFGDSGYAVSVRVPEEYVKGDSESGKGGQAWSKMYAQWYIEASVELYRRNLHAAELNRYVNSSQSRFQRAFQAFTNSFRMDDPFRYVARIACLEALLATEPAELTHQLASRVSWLLHPSDANARWSAYEAMKKYYSLRCKIVHGDTYRTNDFDECRGKLLELVRSLLWKVTVDDNLHGLFCAGEKAQCNEFLKRLSMGCTDVSQGRSEVGDG